MAVRLTNQAISEAGAWTSWPEQGKQGTVDASVFPPSRCGLRPCALPWKHAAATGQKANSYMPAPNCALVPADWTVRRRTGRTCPTVAQDLLHKQASSEQSINQITPPNHMGQSVIHRLLLPPFPCPDAPLLELRNTELARAVWLQISSATASSHRRKGSITQHTIVSTTSLVTDNALSARALGSRTSVVNAVRPLAGSEVCRPLWGPGFATSPFASASSTLIVVSGVRSSC